MGARVVLADGRTVDCHERSHEDLFWALRGAGGGQFGVVTRLRLKTLSIPEATCLDLTWPIDAAAGLLAAWQAGAPRAADAMSASLLAVVPGDVRRPAAVHLFGAWIGHARGGQEALEPFLRAVAAEPASAQLTHLPYRDAKRYLADNGPGDTATAEPDAPAAGEVDSFSKSEFFARALSADTIGDPVEHLTRARIAGQARILDLTPWGGAYNRVPATATAFPHRSASFLLKHEVVLHARSDRDTRAARDWLTRSWALAHPFGTGAVYANFPDPDLAEPAAAAYHGPNLPRLRAVKATYDPGNLFRFHQAIQPGEQ